MILNFYKSENEIKDLDTWKLFAPPMGADKQWKDGRSAKELARYITNSLPNLPKELGEAISPIVREQVFYWSAEYVTDFAKYDCGIGNGRNHDMAMWNGEIFIGIEAKADESLGNNNLGYEYQQGSGNKKHRIEKLTQIVFGTNDIKKFSNIQYQLLTATSAILLEARERKLKKAMLIVIVFKKEGVDDRGKPYYSSQKISNNEKAISQFLETIGYTQKSMNQLQTHGAYADIELFYKKIEITV